MTVGKMTGWWNDLLIKWKWKVDEKVSWWKIDELALFMKWVISSELKSKNEKWNYS